MYPTIGPSLPPSRDSTSAVFAKPCQGSKIHKEDRPLHVAVCNRNINLVSQLLYRSYTDLEAYDSHGETPLFIAAKNNQVDIAHLLIDHGADVNGKSVQSLGIYDKDGYTILQIASENGHYDTVYLLLEHGADLDHHVNDDDTTALWYAINNNHFRIAHLLLDRGATQLVRASENLTALYLLAAITAHYGTVTSAMEQDALELMSLLIEQYGADVHALTTGNHTAMHYAVMHGAWKSAKLLLKYGADLHNPPQLHRAAWHGYLNLMQLCLENGADINQMDHTGCNALHSASKSGIDRPEVLDLLLKYGSKPDICTRGEGLTALHICAKSGQVKSVELLLEHGASVAIYAPGTGTALHCALDRNRVPDPATSEIVRLLLLAGADPELCNDNQLSAKQLARMMGNADLLQTLGIQGLVSMSEAVDKWERQNNHEQQVIKMQAANILESMKTAKVSFESIYPLLVQYDNRIHASAYWLVTDHENIAHALFQQFQWSSDPHYLDAAIELQYIYVVTKEAHFISTGMLKLATFLQERYRITSSFVDLDQAMGYLCTTMICAHEGRHRYQAACLYANLCWIYKGPDASMRSFGIAHGLIAAIVPKTRPLDYTSVSDIRLMASSSVAAAVEAQYLNHALRWFESSRCIVWSYTMQRQMSFDEVRDIAPSLANQRDVIAAQFSKMGELILDRNFRHPAYMSSVTGYGRLVRDLDQLIVDVRNLSGLENFLAPKTEVELRHAAILGPIIIVNIANQHSDALILTQDHSSILDIPLPGIEPERLAQLSSIMVRNQRGNEGEVRLKGAQEQSEFDMAKTLHTLWTSVVEPIFQRLGLIGSSLDAKAKLPRVTWCLSGPLAFLPLHAAGIYDAEHHSLHQAFRYAVHSYTPSLSVLVEALKEKRTKQVNQPTILAISQPATPDHDPLPATVTEVYAIKKICHERLKWLNDSEATIASVLPLIDQHLWIHFACHAIQDSAEPTQSGFMLHDGLLTLRNLMHDRKIGGRKDLAVLSACQTGAGDTRMPEEAVHLAAGMLMTGFQSVIATMWSIKDSDAPIVMKVFYSYLLNNAKGDTAQSAYALHHAVEELRNQVGVKSFSRWVPFMHMGI
ncbi:ankyrin repeat-containing domain protein [Favolaschia claudopus]|uniref:protein S-acyltransferase n=1 Tax=Favolaschia claudopus TaxID=2862362 RepID=A0AAW0DLZ9_9AGAR